MSTKLIEDYHRMLRGGDVDYQLLCGLWKCVRADRDAHPEFDDRSLTTLRHLVFYTACVEGDWDQASDIALTEQDQEVRMMLLGRLGRLGCTILQAA